MTFYLTALSKSPCTILIKFVKDTTCASKAVFIELGFDFKELKEASTF